jgi:S1-C subfamily serine protease
MWHVKFSENEIKRGTFEQLQGLAAKGRILPTTPVKAPDSQKWVRAESVPGLFPQAEEGLASLDPLGDLTSDPLSVGSLPGNPLNPLAVPQKPVAASSGSGIDPKMLMIGGAGIGGVLVLGLIVVVIMSMSGKTPPPVATNPGGNVVPQASATPVATVVNPTPTITPPTVTPTPTVQPQPTTPPAATTPVTATTTPANPPPATSTPTSTTPPATTTTTTAPPATVTTTDPAPATKEMTLPELISHAQPSIVRIDVMTQFGGAVGSGFVVDDKGTVVTNLHVVAGAKAIRLQFSDKVEVDVSALLAVSKEQDLAILRFDPAFDPAKAKSIPLPLATKLPSAGESVAAFGAPKGLSFTTSNGIVSAVRSGDDLRQFGADYSATMVQTSAPISPGNSGGPLVNMKGEVVGVNTVQLTSGQNLNFAVSCTDVKGLLTTAKKTIPFTDLAKYEPPKQEAKTFKDLEKQQKEALQQPEPVEEEWTIGGAPVKATLVTVLTIEKEPRKPAQLDSKDFVDGKYTIPKGLKAHMKLPDGTEKDYNMQQFGTASMKKVRERWNNEAYAAIKLKLVQRGNDRMQGMFAAAQRKDNEGISKSARSIAQLYAFADMALPKEHAEHTRKLIEMNLDIIVAEGGRDQFARVLSDMEAQFKAAIKDSPEMKKAYANLVQEMLSS